ncbi:unnamed protein product [Brassicogethes aeneus]|uniref:Uncharacterized protein n=1 Tax=Brassicogethes aeneus TaxID=1431903 RepID=A0A9P0B9G3_BRAAE|nr:unnamed protein product [Brassicogethes aeneus]
MKGLVLYLKEYTKVSSIHGVRYLGQKRTKEEKVVWTVFLCIMFVIGLFLLLSVWKKYERNPTVLEMDQTKTSIYNIPFPAVSICPLVQNTFDDYQRYIEINERAQLHINLTKKELTEYLYWSILLEHSEAYIAANVEELAVDLIEFIKFAQEKLPNPFENMYCVLNDKVYDNCFDLFTPIITELGLCYTFNMLNVNEIYRPEVLTYEFSNHSMQFFDVNKYEYVNNYAQTYPRRPLYSSSLYPLMINMVNEPYPELVEYKLNGYKCIIHDPTELPPFHFDYTLLPFEHVIEMIVEPSGEKTPVNLAKMRPNKRHCQFANERQLKYFQFYSAKACQSECQKNLTLQMCKCSPFYMPALADEPICGPRELSCVNSVKTIMFDIYESSRRNLTCNCQSRCNHVEYAADTIEYKWNVRNDKHFQSYYHTKVAVSVTSKSFTRVHVFFRSNLFIYYKRNDLYDLTTFLSNYGGLFGLFFGISILSLVELFYFFCIRFFCNFQLHGRNWLFPKKEVGVMNKMNIAQLLSQYFKIEEEKKQSS